MVKRRRRRIFERQVMKNLYKSAAIMRSRPCKFRPEKEIPGTREKPPSVVSWARVFKIRHWFVRLRPWRLQFTAYISNSAATIFLLFQFQTINKILISLSFLVFFLLFYFSIHSFLFSSASVRERPGWPKMERKRKRKKKKP
jgi:hypothetical protein